MVKGRSTFFAFCIAAGLLVSAGEFGVSVAGAGPADSPAAPGELLSHGYDALSENRPDLARKIFQTLLNAYPRSNEAATAADELALLEDDAGARGDSGPAPEDEGRSAPPSGKDAPRQIPPPREPRQPSVEQVAKARMRFLVEVGDRVFFAENSDTLGGRARTIVEAQARWLKAATALGVTIIGRAADGGTSAENIALSLARARAVEAKLIEAGVAPERIKVEARGAGDAIATCSSAMCQAQNRHAESYLRLLGRASEQMSGTLGGAIVRDDTRREASRATAR